jgi:DNA-binding IclR family transcriptional regulator
VTGVDLSQAAEPASRRELNSVGNALRLIEALAHMPDAGISELGRALALSKPAVDRLLVTLAAAGFALKDPETKRYRLSPKLIALADALRARTTIVDVARPYLVELAAQTQESVNLATLAGATVVYLDAIPSQEIFRIETRPGTVLPAYCTALGKAILAFSPPATVEAALRVPPTLRTQYSIVLPELFHSELAEVRRAGFAFDREEVRLGLTCVAAPILRKGMAVGAISISGASPDFDPAAVARRTRATADAIAAKLT